MTTRFDATGLPSPGWADPDSPDYDPLLSLNWPGNDPAATTSPPPARAAWEVAAARVLAAVADAVASARPQFVSTPALALRLGVSVGTVRRMIRDGRVRAVKRGTSTQARLYIPIEEVERLTCPPSGGAL
jgi:excisionase family DNA binding protein